MLSDIFKHITIITLIAEKHYFHSCQSPVYELKVVRPFSGSTCSYRIFQFWTSYFESVLCICVMQTNYNNINNLKNIERALYVIARLLIHYLNNQSLNKGTF